MLTQVAETAGRLSGLLVAPFFGVTSFLRRARTFHPAGDTFLATVVPRGDDAALQALGERLAGRALVRLSGALSKRRRPWLDVLGCAIRFGVDDVAAGEQDLLLATIWRPWTMALSPFTTDARDYLANAYHAVSPFQVAGVGRAFFRLRPLEKPKAARGSRRTRLDVHVARGEAAFRLELRRGALGRWRTVAEVTLTGPAHVDDEALRFSAFRDGRGIAPVGFVHAMRRAVYPVSQKGRGAARQAVPSYGTPRG